MIKKYNKFLNENILDLLKGPSEEEMFKSMEHFLDKPNALLIASTLKDFLPGVKKALELGASVNFKNTENNSPLRIAVLKKNYPIIKYLIENGAYINSGEYVGNILNIVATSDDVSFFKEVIRKTNFIPTTPSLYNFKDKANNHNQHKMEKFLSNIISDLEQAHNEYFKKIVNE